jgi:hypothetical protein
MITSEQIGLKSNASVGAVAVWQQQPGREQWDLKAIQKMDRTCICNLLVQRYVTSSANVAGGCIYTDNQWQGRHGERKQDNQLCYAIVL